ncbi:GntR family transcriptional regulator [Gordonia hydrophobica]|uniref:GntR family transcriptional regulator n=1 Tax=Gordonia hydrophobica TaxID=40516 RepID=A0ABZ2TZC7_9ACTN|nr:GntR family transcriptional regulator [Gordonia hydrophobica]MBM7368876.1 DNA-binding GntR family transcriptional regulator [Gordonia hydrophobica]
MSSPGSAEPAYRALANELRSRIGTGRYRVGERLPTEADLTEEFALSRQTVRRAFVDLVAEGIVYRVPGKGTFVAREHGRYLRQLGSIEDLMALSDDTDMEIVRPLETMVDLAAAGRLRVDTDRVCRLELRRLHGVTPFVLTRVFWPEEIGRLLRGAQELVEGAVSPHTMIGLLEPHLVSPIETCSQSITAVAADDEIADALGCRVGHPVLRVDRLYLDRRDRAVELAVSHFLPEQYTYRVTLRRQSGQHPTQL